MAILPKKEKKRYWSPKPKKIWSNTKSDFNYQCRKWRNTSINFRIKNPLCIQCELKGIIKPATVTDHIKPITQGGDPWDFENMQPLCDSCHNKKSRSEQKNINTIK